VQSSTFSNIRKDAMQWRAEICPTLGYEDIAGRRIAASLKPGANRAPFSDSGLPTSKAKLNRRRLFIQAGVTQGTT
jgi:hypothetical protein